MKPGRLLADELARIFGRSNVENTVDNIVGKWLEWPEMPLISTQRENGPPSS